MNYWNKKESLRSNAKLHTAEMEAKYADEIAACITNTKVYTTGATDNGSTLQIGKDIPDAEHIIIKGTSVSALFTPRFKDKKVCVLNFASYKNPGGMFLNGSSAQEESLCHESFLYNVLRSKESTFYQKNRSCVNKGLYMHRALYSPDVRFFYFGETRLADVLTCAAPNYSVTLKYGGFTKEENDMVLMARVRFIKCILAARNIDVAILGAWGCGVFKQDPAYVARLWMTEEQPVPIVVHAIPDNRTVQAFTKVQQKLGR